ncbi:DUF2339 domain-containing protein [Opitutus sp. GAS368]|uniref:DUF2339 domain-containing protein n=1 Tax=Opitutus sp. GAS368 TaxID=1882749 RepID=UPI00087CE7F6|nr:DUF2339 domain-containing protein [Opitutus sp. GAS368]SDS43758.1 Predicted membrane protein [Opitutus sp. GAS368]
MNEPPQSLPVDRRLELLEARLAALEARLTRPRAAAPAPVTPAAAPLAAPALNEDALEFEVGQKWFANVGIGVLTLAVGFTVSLPYAGLTAGVPFLIGATGAAGLLVLARYWRQSFARMAGYLRGVAVALLYFATLRLYFFGAAPLLTTDSGAGRAVLALVVAGNLVFAWHRRSPGLAGLALATGYATCLAVDAAGFFLPGLVLLAGLAVAGSHRGRWPGLVLAGLLLTTTTYALWAANNPLLGRPFQFVATPALAPAGLLACMLVLGLGPLLRRDGTEEDGLAKSCALLNCALGYGVFLLHTLAVSGAGFLAAHVAASAVFLGLAVLFWVRARSQVATFLYAMTGYLALSVAIIKAAATPGVFVWLSLQSVVVVATAVWFRSRFIVVANFLIGTAIVLGYVGVTEHETGISLGFGIVALVSARILNWQKARLELKTELMRNAYLLGAFVVFPYALYHLAPVRYAGLAWVGLALFYYAMNLVVRNQKFRWMGHATLLLTTLFMVIAGTSRFEPVYRVLSFLALGTVMVLVSLVFTRMRKPPRP